MANYDAEATGRLLFIFIKEVAEKHGVTDLARLNIDLISPDSYKKLGLNMRPFMSRIKLV